jgi:hypothetical protein
MRFDERLGWFEPLPEVDAASDDECVVLRDVSQLLGILQLDLDAPLRKIGSDSRRDLAMAP